MKSTIFATIALLLSLSLCASVALPQPEKIILANGLTVFFLQTTETPLVSFRLLIPSAGTAQETIEGSADLTAELMLKGSSQQTAQAIAEELDFLGARLNSGASEEYFSLSGESLNKNFSRLLTIASQCLSKPSFPQDEFNQERSRRLDGLKAIKDDPRNALPLYFQKAYFGNHPFGKLSGGSETSLAQMTLASIQNFYAKAYTPNKAIMAVVGNFSAAELKKILKSTLATWQGGKAADQNIPPLPAPLKAVCLLIDKPDASQAYFTLGMPGLGATDSLLPAAKILNTLFGERFTCWLNSELRIKRGLTYGAKAKLTSWQKDGLYSISSYTRNDKIGEMLTVTFELIAKARRGEFSSEEITTSRNYILGQFPPTLQGNASKARAYTELTMRGLGFDYYATYLQAVSQTSDDQVKAMAKQLMPTENYVLVVVGNASAIREQLKAFGSFTEKKITDTDF